MTRRQVLTVLGGIGGAGAALGAMAALDLFDDGGRTPFTPPATGDFSLQGRANDGSVVVVGAGIAGLCCAYELGKAGYSVTVVDARTRVGGRSWTVRGGDVGLDTAGGEQRCAFADGRYLNAGPARIAQHHTTIDYCRELGVAIEVFVNDNAEAFVEGGGLVRRQRSVGADLTGYVSELLVKAVGAGALDTELPDEERRALVDHLRAVGALGSSDRGYDTPPGAGDVPGVVGAPDPLDELLAMNLAPRVRADGDGPSEWHQATPMFQPVGGMDRLADALAAMVDDQGGDVRLGAAVMAMRTDGDGVRVELDGDAVRADHGICTLPPWIAAETESDWPADVTAALRAPSPFVTGKIGLEFGRRFWETDDRILGGPSRVDAAARTIWYPSYGYLGSGGVVVGAYPFGPAAASFSDASPAEREASAVDAGRALHGDAYADELASSFSVDWRTTPHSEGAWATWPRYGTEFDRLLEPAGRWWFAGDWLSRASGWQHGAFESARRAVTELHRSVLAG